MRLLALWQGWANDDQIGFHRACEKLVQEGFLEAYEGLPFLSADATGPANPVYQHAVEKAAELKADFIFLQYFHYKDIPDPELMIQAFRKLPTDPTIFTSAGDSFGTWTRRIPYSLQRASHFGDITFMSGMGQMANTLVNKGGKNICLMPHGFCQERFPPVQDVGNRNLPWEVTCVASNYRARNPFSYFYAHKKHRILQIKELSRRYGKKFALFGNGWEGFSRWEGPLPYKEQAKIFRQSRVVVGGHPGGSMDYYLSDREFIALAVGCEFLEFWTPRIDRFFRPGMDWHLYRDNQEMVRIIDKLLEECRGENQERLQTTIRYVRDKHSQYHRMKEMLRIAREYQDARNRKKHYRPELNLFLPEVSWANERQHALRGW
jgi:hypothetical protein